MSTHFQDGACHITIPTIQSNDDNLNQHFRQEKEQLDMGFLSEIISSYSIRPGAKS
jgi:hypothetical protein